MPERDDTVGYKRPPKANRFKPGISGNPSGRPKQTKSFAHELMEELGEAIRIREGAHHIEITKARAIAKGLVRLAIDGDLRAANAVISCCARSQAHDGEQTDEPTAEELDLLQSFIERQDHTLQRSHHPNPESRSNRKSPK